LLEKIQTEKERLIQEGKIKKQKPLPPISDEEKPFTIPVGWVWCRLAEICSKIGSGSTPRGGKDVYIESGIPLFRSQNIHDNGLRYEDIAFIDHKIHIKMLGTHILANDILLNITGGSIGRAALVPATFEYGNVSQHVCIIRLISLHPAYI
jgi:type I restriction enzyme S subunit